MSLEQHLPKLWLSKLGLSKLNWELRERGIEVAGRATVFEKASILTDKLPSEEVDSIILSGFDGLFHQHVYLTQGDDYRFKLDSELTRFNTLMGNSKLDGATVLYYARYPMRFATEDDKIQNEEINVPCSISRVNGILALKILTVGTVNWKGIIGLKIQRPLTVIRSDRIQDAVMDIFFGHTELSPGRPFNFSERAIDIIKHKDVVTFMATTERQAEGAPVGETTHQIFGSKGERQGIRESLPEAFNELVAGHNLRQCSIRMDTDCFGVSDTRLRLHPVSGVVRISSRLDSGNLDKFISHITQ